MAKMFEIKHQVMQVLSIRTRGVATLIPGNNPNILNQVLAKANVSVPLDCSDANAFMVNTTLSRTPGMKGLRQSFTSIRKQWLDVLDVCREDTYCRLNLEFDLKRRPVNPRMVKAENSEYLAFDTVAWVSVEEANLARAIFDKWRRTNCLKTLDDWESWEDFYLTWVALESLKTQRNLKRLPFNVGPEGSFGIFKRMFLKAIKQGGWGFKKGIANSELVELFGSEGYSIKSNDLKNGNKGSVLNNVVPSTPQTQAVAIFLKLKYPEFDLSQVFIILESTSNKVNDREE